MIVCVLDRKYTMDNVLFMNFLYPSLSHNVSLQVLVLSLKNHQNHDLRLFWSISIYLTLQSSALMFDKI